MYLIRFSDFQETVQVRYVVDCPPGRKLNTFNPLKWTFSSSVQGGPRRVNHAAVAVGDRIFSFGGYCTGDNYRDERPIDVFVLDTNTFRWTEVAKPEDPRLLAYWPYQRYGHTVVARGETCYLFGGRNDEAACNLLFTFCTNTYRWSRPRVEGDIPGERDGHSATIIGKFYDKLF